MADREKILAGREAVGAYRTAHTGLHSKGWHKGVSEEHTPLLEEMLVKLEKLGFNSLGEFFTASTKLGIKESGSTKLLSDWQISDGGWN